MKGTQSHHISYDPEITIDILKDLHVKFHGHGTGRAKGFKGTKGIRKKHHKGPFINKYGQLYVPAAIGFKARGNVFLMGTGDCLLITHPDSSSIDMLNSLRSIVERLKHREVPS